MRTFYIQLNMTDPLLAPIFVSPMIATTGPREYTDKIAAEASVPRSLTPRENAIVLYSNCNNPKAFGDFAQCGTLAYQISQKVRLPIYLTSQSTDVHRFDTLYQSKLTGNHAIYGSPFRVTSIQNFDTTRVTILGYIEVAWCKPNNAEYVRKVMMRDGGKCAFVGTANYEAPFDAPTLEYNDTFSLGKGRNFLAGYDRDGVTFSPFADFFTHIDDSELALDCTQENLVVNHTNKYGLVYAAQTENQLHDLNYMAGYLWQFKQLGQSNCVVAISDLTALTRAACRFAREYHLPIMLINPNKNESYFIQFKNGNLITKHIPSIFDPTNNQGILCVYAYKSLPNLHFRRILASANRFVALTGTSSAIEGLGEGKIVYYQFFETNKIFAHSYLLAAAAKASKQAADREILKLLATLFAKKELLHAHENELRELLSNESLCHEVATINRSLTLDAANRLSERLLGWLTPSGDHRPTVEGENATPLATMSL